MVALTLGSLATGSLIVGFHQMDKLVKRTEHQIDAFANDPVSLVHQIPDITTPTYLRDRSFFKAYSQIGLLVFAFICLLVALVGMDGWDENIDDSFVGAVVAVFAG